MSDPEPSPGRIAALRAALLDWYDSEGRALPWRIRPEDRAAGRTADPYAVWLSEIMLQQTTVPHATPYWQRFLDLWPTVHDLAAAPREQVMAEWAGLGYYARARNLHACAQAVSEAHGGVFPDDLAALRALPGIGEYTSNAIRAAAFDKPASVVDGNVERAISRLFAIKTPLPKSRAEIKRLAGMLADPDRPGDYAQAIMDLGATVCRPRAPDCAACPWSEACAARKTGAPEQLPVKQKKAAKPVRRGAVFAALRGSRAHLVERPDSGLLGGMLGLPGTGWDETPPDAAALREARPFEGKWARAGAVRHVFTHFALELDVHRAPAPDGWRPNAGVWVDAANPDGHAVPTLFRKALKLVVKS